MNTVHIPWQDNCSTITSALQFMLNHEIIVDALFKKGKISFFYAHKLVLSIWSSKFADLIAENDERQMFSIPFEEDENVLRIIIEYLYSSADVNSFAKLPLEKLIQALEISERYGINHVYRICLSSLRRKKINPLNVIDYFDYGLRKNFHSIAQKCVKTFENQGISITHIKQDISVNTLLTLLSLNKVAMNSEADLLSLAISWLSFPDNKRYKSHVLSLIDLQAINFKEYKDICNRYPHFFSDAELSSIMLSALRQDLKLLPEWYIPKTKTVVENTCSLCIGIHKKLEISKPLQILNINKRRDLKKVTQKFEFQFQQFKQVKLLNVELNFGPGEVLPSEFTLEAKINQSVSVKNYFVTTKNSNGKYEIVFKSPMIFKSTDTLTLNFNFRRGLLANNIHIIWPFLEEGQNSYSVLNEDIFKINMCSSKLVFCLSTDRSEKFIVSSFYLNVCDEHRTFLSRKCLQVGNFLSMLCLNPEFEDVSKVFPNKVRVKEEMADIKMDIDDQHQDYGKQETLKDLKTRIKMETIPFGLSVENQYSPFQIMTHDRMPYTEKEVIDLTDDM